MEMSSMIFDHEIPVWTEEDKIITVKNNCKWLVKKGDNTGNFCGRVVFQNREYCAAHWKCIIRKSVNKDSERYKQLQCWVDTLNKHSAEDDIIILKSIFENI